MNAFQIVFIAFCTLQAALSLRRFVKTRHLTAAAFAGAWLPNIAFLIITLLWFSRMSRQ